MINWLHELPVALGATTVCLSFLLPTLIGSAFLQPAVGRLLRDEAAPNKLVGLLLNTFSLYYGVLLALLSIAVFDNYDKARDAAGREASSLMALYRDVRSYPEPVRTSLHDILVRYIDEETGPGWHDQRRGEPSRWGTSLVDELSRTLMEFKPDPQAGNEAAHRETLRMLNEFLERRRLRIEAAGTKIPPVIWYVVLIGAALNVLVLWLFDLKRTTHFILEGVLTIFIGLVIYMVAALDQPFRGAHGLDPVDLIQIRQQMHLDT